MPTIKAIFRSPHWRIVEVKQETLDLARIEAEYKHPNTGEIHSVTEWCSCSYAGQMYKEYYGESLRLSPIWKPSRWRRWDDPARHED